MQFIFGVLSSNIALLQGNTKIHNKIKVKIFHCLRIPNFRCALRPGNSGYSSSNVKYIIKAYSFRIYLQILFSPSSLLLNCSQC
jgi:hypothetical protein